MKWADLNTTPCGILRAGEPMIIAAAGSNPTPPFLWYWAGEMNIKVIPGGSFNEQTGELRDASGATHGWVTPLTDMPEITDINQAMAQHSAMTAETRKSDFSHYLAEQIKMASNSIGAE